MEGESRKRAVGKKNVRIALVIFQQHVVTRLQGLDEMIDAFEAAKRVIDDNYFMQVSGDKFDEVHDMDISTESITNFISSIPRSEVDQWVAMSKDDQKIFRNKVKVFVRWFFCLWD